MDMVGRFRFFFSYAQNTHQVHIGQARPLVTCHHSHHIGHTWTTSGHDTDDANILEFAELDWKPWTWAWSVQFGFSHVQNFTRSLLHHHTPVHHIGRT